jgi:hypothetical protein
MPQRGFDGSALNHFRSLRHSLDPSKPFRSLSVIGRVSLVAPGVKMHGLRTLAPHPDRWARTHLSLKSEIPPQLVERSSENFWLSKYGRVL